MRRCIWMRVCTSAILFCAVPCWLACAPRRATVWDTYRHASLLRCRAGVVCLRSQRPAPPPGRQRDRSTNRCPLLERDRGSAEWPLLCHIHTHQCLAYGPCEQCYVLGRSLHSIGYAAEHGPPGRPSRESRGARSVTTRRSCISALSGHFYWRTRSPWCTKEQATTRWTCTRCDTAGWSGTWSLSFAP